MKFKNFSLLLCLLFAKAIFPGFPEETLVKTQEGHIEIGQLEKKSLVYCYNLQNKIVDTKQVTATKIKQKVKEIVCIILEGEKISCSRKQKFYLPLKNLWEEAVALEIGDYLLDDNGKNIPIEDIFYAEIETTLIGITVADRHNFFISSKNILAHNAAPLAIGLSWAFGSGALEFIGASIATAFFGGAVAVGVHHNFKNKTFHLSGKEFPPNTDPKAPGKPTKKDGFKPPKKDDGKPVKVKKGKLKGRWGWKDRNGDIWVPTGPDGHGGAHWDVQLKKGGYRNIYPGGRIR